MDNETIQLLIDHLKDVVFQMDKEGCWTYLNPAWEHITGFSIEETIGSHFQGYVLPDDRKKVTALFRQINSQKYPVTQTEVRFITKPGKIIWIEFSLKLIRENIIIGSLRDITVSTETEKRLRTTNKKLVEGLQREQAMTEEYQSLNEKLLENEEELRGKIEKISELNHKLSESEELLKHASKVAKVGGWEIDIPTRNIKLTDEAYHLIDLPVASSIDLEKAIELLYPDHQQMLQRAFEQLIRKGKEFDIEAQLVTANGKHIWVRIIGKSEAARNKSAKLYGIFQDITEKKQAMQHIEEYAILFNLCRDLIAIADFNGYFLQLNPSWQKTLGFSLEELLNKPFLDFVHPDDREKTLEAAQQLSKSDTEYIAFVNRYQTKEGAYRWISWNAKSSTEQGKIYNIARDITEIKEAERKLKASEEKYRSVVKAMSEGIIVYAASGEITTCNAAAEEILGLSFAQMTGRTPFDSQWRAVHEDSSTFPGETHPAMITLNTGLPQRNVIMGVHKPNGELTWISVNSQPIFPEDKKKIQAVVASFTDISMRKQAEQALRESERRLRTLIANTPAVVYRCAYDEDRTMEFISEEIFNVCGYVAHDFIHSNERSYKSIIDSHDQQYVKEVIGHALQKNKPFQMEYRIRHKDKNARWVLERGQGVFDEQGNVKFLDGIVLDITEKKSIETAIRQHNDQLRKANMEMDNFVYRVSHDLRAPLSSSLGLIEVIHNEPDQENIASYLQLMRNILQKQDKFIRDILDYSRNSRLEPQITKIEFRALVEDILEQLEYIESDKNIKRKVEIDQKLNFFSDSYRLKIILGNLISNALRYADSKKPTPYVKIKLTANQHSAIIRVEDNGIGIHQQYLDKIFDMFYRATATKPGSGLGLYIVNEAVSKLNGHIKVESAFGEGSRFIVDIPNRKDAKSIEH